MRRGLKIVWMFCGASCRERCGGHGLGQPENIPGCQELPRELVSSLRMEDHPVLYSLLSNASSDGEDQIAPAPLSYNPSYTEVHFLRRISKYFQAILTLILCGILLSLSLCLITRTKNWWKHRKPARNVPKVIVEEWKEVRNGRQESVKNRDEEASLRIPKVQFFRRPSGPFAEEVLAFVEESYKKEKKVKKEDPK